MGLELGLVLCLQPSKDFCHLSCPLERAKSLALRGPNPACLCVLLHPELIGHTLWLHLSAFLVRRGDVVNFELTIFNFLYFMYN